MEWYNELRGRNSDTAAAEVFQEKHTRLEATLKESEISFSIPLLMTSGTARVTLDVVLVGRSDSGLDAVRCRVEIPIRCDDNEGGDATVMGTAPVNLKLALPAHQASQ